MSAGARGGREVGRSPRVGGQHPPTQPSIHPSTATTIPGRRRVKHPNILQLVDVYITRKEYFIFLEL